MVVPDLNASGGGWIKSDSIRVDGIGLLQGSDYVAINQPGQSVRLPVDLNEKQIQGDHLSC